MDLKQIRLVIELMKRSDLTDFEVEEEGFKLRIRRNPGHLPAVLASPIAPPASPGPVSALPVGPSAKAAQSGSTPAPGGPAAPPGEDPAFVYVKSPMVGTFYRSASPESPPFVEAGATVVESTVVCIIEAMKIMNEIQAEVRGSVAEVLVESGQPVEYGQRLFKVKRP